MTREETYANKTNKTSKAEIKRKIRECKDWISFYRGNNFCAWYTKNREEMIANLEHEIEELKKELEERELEKGEEK